MATSTSTRWVSESSTLNANCTGRLFFQCFSPIGSRRAKNTTTGTSAVQTTRKQRLTRNGTRQANGRP
jgi:hypothetical protein